MSEENRATDPLEIGDPNAVRRAEERVAAVEGLFLQVAFDLVNLSTALNAVQQHVTGLRHERMTADLRAIYERWLGLLKEAEKQGRVTLPKKSGLIVPNVNKIN